MNIAMPTCSRSICKFHFNSIKAVNPRVFTDKSEGDVWNP